MFYKIGDVVEMDYVVPQCAPGNPGPSGKVIMKILSITAEIVWGEQLPESPYHPKNVRFYKKYIKNIRRYTNRY